MSVITLDKGRDLKLAGRPEEKIEELARPDRVGLQPRDFHNLKLRLDVKEGDAVITGEPLFHSKDDPRLRWVAPATGTVAQIRRGERRCVEAVVLDVAGEEKFKEFTPRSVDDLNREAVIERLLEGGVWPSIRQRPFDKIASPDGRPKAIVVGAMRKDEFHPDPDKVVEGEDALFQFGLDALTQLTDGKVYLAIGKDAKARALTEADNVEIRRFAGPYPSGLVGTQVYHLCPPEHGEVVWTLDVQDVLAAAAILRDGKLRTRRHVALSGPAALKTGTLVTRAGVPVAALTRGRVAEGELRFVSGGVLNGRAAAGDGFLGYYDSALHVLREGRWREMLGFLRPGFDRYSLSRTFLSSLLPNKRFALDTNQRGSVRAFVQTGVYESVCPVDLLPQQLAKSVIAQDFEEMEAHGILDCVQCGLCTFVCPSKIEVAAIIQDGIDLIEKEG